MAQGEKNMKKMLVNYHTHCNKCMHAGGTEEEYVIEAIKNKFDILGISDHVPYKGDMYGSRMGYSAYKEYLYELTRLKDLYKDKIQIYRGFESEYLPEFYSYYEELLADENCDYLILGQHFFTRKDGNLQYVYDIQDSTELYIEYANSVVEAMNTGFYKMVCHPDVIGVGDFVIDDNYMRAFDIMLNDASKKGYVLEYNANGHRRQIKSHGGVDRGDYPLKELWSMIEGTDIPVIVGSDCHSVDALYDEKMKKSIEYLNNGRFNVKTEIM